ncbi:hypothetical protein ACFH04_13725 [Streptomyces noboritoensis]|uniref:GNAT family N-acetyltransferase n=1 Tax=Streptomyces noboritoensis TaxID=67337 RepID=A0ABV6TI06_9ACTN
MAGLHVIRGDAEGSRRRPGAELASNPSLVTMSFSSVRLAGADPSSDTLQEWTVALMALDDDEDEVEIGCLRLYRLCDYTGYSRILAADEVSGDLLHIAETVLDGEAYSDAFEKAVEMPVGDLLILDEVVLARPWRGFRLGPVFAQEAIVRLQGGCCAVACAPGAGEPPADGREPTREEWRAAGMKIAALWQTIGFQPFKDGVYLHDTACDHDELLLARRADLDRLSAEYRSARC